MSKPKILLQLDPDRQASVFDSVVAIDSGVDQLLRHANVQDDEVQNLVHGAMFTRGTQDLHNTAIFVGGSDVAAGENLLERVTSCFFGPMRVSVMLDANGANTTAAAAVLAAAKHVQLAEISAAVLAATGPVGQRVVRLLAGQGTRVRVASRSAERAEQVCRSVRDRISDAPLEPMATPTAKETANAIDGCQLVVAAGAAGVELLSAEVRSQAESLRVAIDLNAVPPVGIGGVEVTDKAAEHGGAICYGAIGVGGTKMKIHKAAVKQLFQANDQVLDAEEIFAIGQELLAEK